jgi:hypothetical protein
MKSRSPKAAVGLVDELEAVLGPVQDRNEARRLLEQPPLPLGLGGNPALGHDLARDLGAGAEEPGDRATLVTHGRVGEGEMRLLRIATPLHHERDILHVNGLATESLLDDGQQVGPDLVPDLQEVMAQGSRMLACEDLRIGVVVEQRALCAPGDEHRLARAEHDADQRLQRLRPDRRWPERRCGPVMRADECPGGASAGQEDLVDS